jgi:hypothetical protein
VCASASVVVRRKNVDGTYQAFDAKLRVRKNGVALFVTHPIADAAVVYGDLPDVPMTGLIPAMLATDDRLDQGHRRPVADPYPRTQTW